MWTATYRRAAENSKHLVTLQATAGGLAITRRSGEIVHWPYSVLRRRAGRDGKVLFERGKGGSREILSVGDPAAVDAICRHAPHLHWTSWTESRWKKCIVLFGGLLALSVSGYIWGVPAAAGAAVSYVPPQVIYKLSEAMLNETVPPKLRCLDPKLVAVQKLADKLSAARPGARAQIVVGDFAYAHSFPLPGAVVVITRGMLARAGTPENLAGIIAHDLHHIRAADPARLVVTPLAYVALKSLITRDFTGKMASLAASLGTPSFQPAEELAADAAAIESLLAAGIDPAPAIDFFRSLETDAENQPGASNYRLAHPRFEDRAERMKQQVRPARFQPIDLGNAVPWRQVTLSCASGVSP
ncbi:MAG: hypothetical protein FJW20_03435 [Acidimicrobiia bacterium]|nr:hypothetical protein [Acidimicrobiia bacterium]